MGFILKEVVHTLNNNTQTLLTELTSNATIHLSDLPFRSGYLLIFGLAITTSLISNAGDKVEKAIH